MPAAKMSFDWRSSTWVERAGSDLTDDEQCVVCGSPMDEYHQTSCQMCGGKFHQPWDTDAQVPQCGSITSHEEALALVFLCTNCVQAIQET